MEYDKSYKIQRFKQNVANIFERILSIIYITSTACIPIYVFKFTFSLKNNFTYALAVSFVSITLMDIVCSILEDIFSSIYKIFENIKEKKLQAMEDAKRKKEGEIKQLEKILLEKDDYDEEIQWAKSENENLIKEIKKHKEKLPEDIAKKIEKVCDIIKEILDVLKKDTEEYYPLRHTFKVYFPEFKKTTCQFISIAEGDSLDEETITEFLKLVEEFNQYLNYIKSSINKQDKLSLRVGTKSLVKILEAERKKGETQCGRED